MLKPPGKNFARVAIASTLCPACHERVEHPVNYSIETLQSHSAGETRTRLVANRTLLIHLCSTPSAETA